MRPPQVNFTKFMKYFAETGQTIKIATPITRGVVRRVTFITFIPNGTCYLLTGRPVRVCVCTTIQSTFEAGLTSPLIRCCCDLGLVLRWLRPKTATTVQQQTTAYFKCALWSGSQCEPNVLDFLKRAGIENDSWIFFVPSYDEPLLSET